MCHAYRGHFLISVDDWRQSHFCIHNRRQVAGITHAEKNLKNVKGDLIAEQKLTVEKGKVVSYGVIKRVSFVLD